MDGLFRIKSMAWKKHTRDNLSFTRHMKRQQRYNLYLYRFIRYFQFLLPSIIIQHTVLIHLINEW